MASFKSIIGVQHDLLQRICRIVENLRKLGKEKITRETLDSRLQLLQSQWEKFSSNHESIILHHSEEGKESPYFKNDWFNDGTEAFLKAKAELLYMRNALPASMASHDVSMVSTGQGITRALPKITLPKFSGEFHEWLTFRDLFQSLVIEKSDIAAVEKLHYLKTHCIGEAAGLLSNFPVTELNFQRAWDSLVSRYQNKRILLASYFEKLERLKPTLNSVDNLKHLMATAREVNAALAALEITPQDTWNFFLVYFLTHRFDTETHKDWEFKQGNSDTPASFESLEEFVDGRIRALELVGCMPKQSQPSKSKYTVRAHVAASNFLHCSCCRSNHYIASCPLFIAKSLQERRELVVAKQLCYNCLGDHRVNQCRTAKRCRICGERHHTLLHSARSPSSLPVAQQLALPSSIPAVKQTDASISPPNFTTCNNAPSSSATPPVRSHCISAGSDVVQGLTLLATAQVILEAASGQRMTARALLDQGSEISFASESLAQVLRLPRNKASIPVVGIGAHQAGSTRGSITLKVFSRFQPAVQCIVKTYILPRLTGRIPASEVDVSSWPHLRNLEFADPAFSIPGPVDLILGADVYGYMLRDSVLHGDQHTPVAQLTAFGWIVSGPAVAPASNGSTKYSFSTSLDNELHALIESFWKQEEISVHSSASHTKEEEACAAHFANTHSRTPSGRYVVRLPFSKSPQGLGDSRAAAAQTLQRTQQRIRRNSKFGEFYSEFLKEYEALSHMIRVPNTLLPSRHLFYLPHHGVFQENSSTTKFRVVFNGSMKTSSGISLNDCLHIGPNLMPNLAKVILAWRFHAYVFIADIEKMYRQILVHPSDRDYQRILWNPSGVPQEFQLCTVTYGVACAPYLALRVIHQLANDEGHRFPLAATILRSQMYVDDILSGGDDIQQAQNMACQSRDLLMAGGFPLRKWASNDVAVIKIVAPHSNESSPPRSFNEHNISRVLGMSWDSVTDAFIFQFHSLPVLTAVTKRAVLSRVARFFDPLGWVTPITVTAKIFMQQLWKLRCDWDSALPDTLAKAWLSFEASLTHITTISIPRWFGTNPSTLGVELHGFSDASQDAIGAAVYLRVYSDVHTVRISLLSAKSKVAPIAKHTIPRLELAAAVLLVRLIKRVSSDLNFEVCPVHLWVDSSVALSWIRGQPTQWKEFVANRVAFIQEQAPHAIWHHIAGVENPADCASRGISPQRLVSHDLWWSGPSWLSQPSAAWPKQQNPSVDSTTANNINLERRSSPVVSALATSNAVQWDLVDRYSSLQKLLRVTAWILHACAILRKLDASCKAVLSPSQISAAEHFWIKQTQQVHFSAELKAISRKASLPRSHFLLRLTPFVDEEGILRLGGRLKNSQLDPDAKHPILLPRVSSLTLLVIDDAHRRTLHGGTQVMLALLRQKFWIIGGRAPVSSFVRRCVRCSRYRAITAQEVMGQLPSTRVIPSRPFTNSGVDYAGPFSIKSWRGRSARLYKGFLIVFVCFATSAVHLELATDYSTQGFLAAFRRFTSRRGICQTITSDCGTNLIGADAELKRLFNASSKEAQNLAHLIAADGTQWRFNPPAAPHFGGKWEAAVKSVKFHIRRVIGDAILTYEEFTTLLTQIEAVLNSRPLCALSDDPSDVEALTPAHFLVGASLSTLPDHSLNDIPTSRLSRWQLIQQFFERFWRRWSAEYLQRLQNIGKWQNPSHQVKVGSLVLLVDDRYPPSKWPLARVVDTHPGADGYVRVVTVKTSTSTLKRPIVKVCPLPVDSS